MVPPRRIFEQIGNFVSKNATELLMINLSDLRPVPLGTLATMAMAWNASKYFNNNNNNIDPVSAESQFLAEFALSKYI